MLFLTVLALSIALGEEKNEEKPKKDAVAEAAIPPGAVQIGPQSWRHTDAEGKRWIYRRTPFGVAKVEAPDGEDEKAAVEAPADMKAYEEGDSVRFERSTPFGVIRWVKKKTELNEVEKAAWERARPKPAEKTGDGKQ